MDLNKENAITIVALIITVIVMLILLGVGVQFGSEALNKAKLEDIKTDMSSIKTKAKIVAEKYNFKDIENLIGSTITDEEAQKLGIQNNNEIRKWSNSDLNEQGLSNIEGDVYVVQYNLENPNNCEVYYLTGYQGKYSLADLETIQ